jgi:hypothetical protein
LNFLIKTGTVFIKTAIFALNLNAIYMSNLIYWILFLISAALMVLLLVFSPAWFWVMLPFTGTFLVKALNVI